MTEEIKNNSFVLEQSNLKLFQSVIENFKEFVEEVEFVIGKDGISSLAVDKGAIVMVDLSLPIEFFKDFHFVEEDKFLINASVLNSAIKRLSSEKDVLFDFKDGKLKLKGEKKNFNLPMMDFSSEIGSQDRDGMKKPSLEYYSSVVVPTKSFKEALADFNVYSQFDRGKLKSVGNIRLQIIDQKFNLGTELDLGYSNKTNVDDSKIEGVGVSCKYQYELLLKLVSKGFTEMKLEFREDYPLRVIYADEKKLMTLEFILAPVVVND